MFGDKDKTMPEAEVELVKESLKLAGYDDDCIELEEYDDGMGYWVKIILNNSIIRYAHNSELHKYTYHHKDVNIEYSWEEFGYLYVKIMQAIIEEQSN